MNAQLKTILLTVLTLSALTIALVELSGVSKTALWNKYKIGSGDTHHTSNSEKDQKRQESVDNMPSTKIEFEDTKHDFGKLKEGVKVRHTYKFKNVGEHPLMISNIEVSCGCTAPEYSKHPVAPGEYGEITLEFNSKNQKGSVNKNAIVVSNASPERISIGFNAEVE